jgi:hypothetical protein
VITIYAQPTRVGRALESVEDVSHSNAEGDVLDHVVLDERAKEVRRQCELLLRVAACEKLKLYSTATDDATH